MLWGIHRIKKGRSAPSQLVFHSTLIMPRCPNCGYLLNHQQTCSACLIRATHGIPRSASCKTCDVGRIRFCSQFEPDNVCPRWTSTRHLTLHDELQQKIMQITNNVASLSHVYIHKRQTGTIETNYWASPLARRGMFFLGFDKEAYYLLIPDMWAHLVNSEWCKAQQVIITYGKWSHLGDRHGVRIVFDDNSECPYKIYLLDQQTDMISKVWNAPEDEAPSKLTLCTRTKLNAHHLPCRSAVGDL